MTTRSRTTWMLFVAALIASAAAAQSIPLEVEIGYRWLDLGGSNAMYRTQINERAGFVLRSLTYHSVASNSGTTWADSLRIDADDIGTGPLSALRLEASRSEAYRLNLRFRRADAFSELPLFANPLASRGITASQHVFDRTRDSLDAELELQRWSSFKPFVGYSWDRHEGPGTTTYHVGQDEFLLLQDLDDTSREIRAGASFSFGNFSGQVTQGWRSFRGRESLELAPGGSNPGNSPDPVLGRPVFLDTLTRRERTDVDTPFTSVYLTGTASQVRLTATYSRFAAESDRSDREDLAGSLASFAIGRFFSGQTESIAARAKNTTWRGGANAEMSIADGVDLFAGFQREHRELAGSALIDTIYLQSITFGGADPRDLRVILSSSNGFDRDETTATFGVAARPKGPFSFHAGYSRSTQEVTVAPDLSEIVIGSQGGQQGTFDRDIDTLETAATFARSSVMITASWKRDDAGAPILRTDFLDRDRYRVRAAWKAPRFVRIGFTADETKQSSDWPEVAHDAKIRQYAGDVELAPAAPLRLRASASRFRADSTLQVRRPENFATETSVRLEKGKSFDGGFSLIFPRVSLDADAGTFENEGTLPFKLDRWRARLTFPLWQKTGLAAEWARDKYRDAATSLGGFEATRYGLYLRLTP